MTSLTPLNALVVESPRLTALFRHSRPADGICQEFHRTLAVLWQPPFKELSHRMGVFSMTATLKQGKCRVHRHQVKHLLPSNVPTAATVPCRPARKVPARKLGPVFSGFRPFVRIFRIVTFPAYWCFRGLLAFTG